VHEERIKQLQDSDKMQWTHIDGLEKALRSYVPVWVTIVLSVAGFVTGSALTFAVTLVKLAGNNG
jgi:hypothetical protein